MRKIVNLFTNRMTLIALLSFSMLAFSSSAYGIIGANQNAKNYEGSTYEVVEKNIESTISTSGKVKSDQSLTMAFSSSGEITEINVKPGDQVKKGDLIAKINPDGIQSQIDSYAGNLSSLQSQYSSTSRDYSNLIGQLDTNILDLEGQVAKGQEYIPVSYTQPEKVNTQSEFGNLVPEMDIDEITKSIQDLDILDEKSIDQAKLMLKVAKIQREQLIQNQNISLVSLTNQISQAQSGMNSLQGSMQVSSEMRAPFDGRILDVPFQVGENYTGGYANTGIKIANMDRLIVEANVNELDILDIELEQKSYITLDADSDIQFEGKVVSISQSPLEDMMGVTNYVINVEVTSHIEKVYEGMNVSVEIVNEQKSDILSIPQIAVKREDGSYYVNIWINEKEEKQIVGLGIESDSDVEILEGLSVGDTIVF